MANVVDSLLVTLGLDTKDFEAGRKKVDSGIDSTKKRVEKSGKQIAASGKQGAEFFGSMQKAAVKFFAVLAAARGITQFVSQTISMGANLSRASRNLNLSANELHKWGNAAKQSGGSMEGFLGTMQGLSQQLTEIQQTGASAMTPLLNFINVGVADSAGKAKGLNTLILDIAEGLERSTLARADKFNMLKMAGFDDGTANVILRGRKDAEAFVAGQVGMSDEMAKKMEDQERRWIAIQDKVRQIATDVLEKILPAIEKISPLIGGLVDGFSKLNEMTDGWAGTLIAAALAVKALSVLLPTGAAAGAAAAGGGGAAGAAAGGLLAGWAAKLAKLGLGAGLMMHSGSLNTGEDEELARRRNLPPTIDAPGSRPNAPAATESTSTMREKMAAAEKAAGLKPGLIESVRMQETGGRQAFIDDPAKYHYEKNAEGKRVAGHTGKISTAFGPFGILESTGKNPGYGVTPLKDKSFDEQLRFMSEYLAARIKHSGSVEGGLAGYGEGSKYANQVLSRTNITGGGALSGVNTAGTAKSSTQTITVGAVNVYPPNGDAKTIASNIRGELAAQANTGAF